MVAFLNVTDTCIPLFTVESKFQHRILWRVVWFLMTESQNGWGQKVSSVAIFSNCPPQSGPARPICPGTYPDGFWISPRRETP